MTANSCSNALYEIIKCTNDGFPKILPLIFSTVNSKSFFTRLTSIKCWNVILNTWNGFNHQQYEDKYLNYLLTILNDSNQKCRDSAVECYKSMKITLPLNLKNVYNKCNKALQKKLEPSLSQTKPITSNIKKNILKQKSTQLKIKKSIKKNAEVIIEKINNEKYEMIKENIENIPINKLNQINVNDLYKTPLPKRKFGGKAKRFGYTSVKRPNTITAKEHLAKRVCLSTMKKL